MAWTTRKQPQVAHPIHSPDDGEAARILLTRHVNSCCHSARPMLQCAWEPTFLPRPIRKFPPYFCPSVVQRMGPTSPSPSCQTATASMDTKHNNRTLVRTQSCTSPTPGQNWCWKKRCCANSYSHSINRSVPDFIRGSCSLSASTPPNICWVGHYVIYSIGIGEEKCSRWRTMLPKYMKALDRVDGILARLRG